MTDRPRIGVEGSLLPGLLSLALFGVLVLVVVNTPFGEAAGFGGASVTSNIGYALLDLTALQTIEAEPFLVSFLLIALLLDAALDASLVLAKREEDGRPVTALFSVRTSQTRREDAGSGPGVRAGSGQRTDAAADGGAERAGSARSGTGGDDGSRSEGGERA